MPLFYKNIGKFWLSSSVNIFYLSVWLSICLYPINVKTAKSIGLNMYFTWPQKFNFLKIVNIHENKIVPQIFYFVSSIRNGKYRTKNKTTHSCMPSPLAPDPIRVQSCVCCLFWTTRNSMAVTSIFLSISLSNQSYQSFNRRYQ